MKSAKSRSKQRNAKDGVRLTSKKVVKPMKKRGIENTVVAKATTEFLLENCKDPIERSSMEMGIEDAKLMLASCPNENDIHNITVDQILKFVDEGKEKANVILELVDAGKLSLPRAERELVKLQTEARGGIPVDEDETKKAVAAVLESARSLVDEFHEAQAAPAARRARVIKARSK
jgi:hypothetical protein